MHQDFKLSLKQPAKNFTTAEITAELDKHREFICDQKEKIEFLDEQYKTLFPLLKKIRTSFRAIAIEQDTLTNNLDDLGATEFLNTANSLDKNNPDHQKFFNLVTLASEAYLKHHHNIASVCETFKKYADFMVAPFTVATTFKDFITACDADTRKTYQNLNQIFLTYLLTDKLKLKYFQAITGSNDYNHLPTHSPLTEGNIAPLAKFLSAHPNLTQFLYEQCINKNIEKLNDLYQAFKASSQAFLPFSDPDDFKLFCHLFSPEFQQHIQEPVRTESALTLNTYPFAEECLEIITSFKKTFPSDSNYRALVRIIQNKKSDNEKKQSLRIFFQQHPKVAVFWEMMRIPFNTLSNIYRSQQALAEQEKKQLGAISPQRKVFAPLEKNAKRTYSLFSSPSALSNNKSASSGTHNNSVSFTAN